MCSNHTHHAGSSHAPKGRSNYGDSAESCKNRCVACTRMNKPQPLNVIERFRERCARDDPPSFLKASRLSEQESSTILIII